MYATLAASNSLAQEPILGSTGAHDPSTMITNGGRYYIYYTGTGIQSKSSADKVNWTAGPQVFSSAPSWIAAAGIGAGNNLWAPDIILLNGTYYLYYSASTFGSQVSGIGVATNSTLNPSDPNYHWTDLGAVIQSDSSVNYNAIDPSVLLAGDGRLCMSFGSYWSGIKLIELDPATGKRISANSPIYSLAYHSPIGAVEGSCLVQHGSYYYLFANWDTCCSGINSTYNIRIGRSTSVTGPYLDRNGVDLLNNGGTMFLESTGRYIGPGHAGIMTEGGTNWFTYHYYDGNNSGTAKLGLGRLDWGADGWPRLTNDWCAFYTFEADAREHLGIYNGQLNNGAVVTNTADRSGVLKLNGTNQYVTLPLSVANASTFAGWVNWNGGAPQQRIFDFGAGTTAYLYLTPAANNGKLHFTITTSGSGGENVIDAPTALPTGSWSHVAVTLDGARGVLYLNGNPVATNANLTLRPWQLLARSNYLGKSQSPSDPAFDGLIDSFRIYGRTLSGAEIQMLSQAHPSLAHRYSFIDDVSDSVGCARGSLRGAAVLASHALALDGSAGTYANLPGTGSSPSPGLVTGCASVTIEFWGTFGVNGNWSRVFDFGNTNGTSGQRYLFFSPHTSVNSHRLALSTTAGTSDLDVTGTLDGRTVHVVCITDPTKGYSAIYTNGVLESAKNGSLPPLSGVSSALAWLGRSLYSADAWLNGSLDEFRIYDGRLTPEEIAASDAAGPDALVEGLPATPFQQWQLQYFGSTNNPSAAATADPDGDGMSNTNEFLAGTNPTNSLSGLRILSVVQQSDDVNITWATAGGHTNAVQATAGDGAGGYSTNFTDLSGLVIIPGSGDATTNYVDVGGATNVPSRYYRIRLVP